MKVLFLIDTLEGYGAEKSIVQIAMNLRKANPVFVHLYRGEKLKTSLQEKGIKVYSLNIPCPNDFEHAVKLISPIIENENPDILHSTLFRADMVARKIKTKYPDIISVGSFVSNSYGKQRYNQLTYLSKIKLFSTQLRDKMTVNKVDYFISNSKAIKLSNVKALCIPGSKVTVIYRGRSFLNLPEQKIINHKLRNELGLGTGRVFLNVGRLQKSKGQIDLLHAFRKFLIKHPNSFLLLAGEGSSRKELEDIVKRFNLQESVLLLGYRDDVQKLISLADFFVFPSYFEGLPGALIEAIIGKVPSIVSNIPENRECFPEEGALFFPPGDVNAIEKSLERGLNLKDWKQRINSSFEHARRRFDVKQIGSDYDLFYEEILRKKEI